MIEEVTRVHIAFTLAAVSVWALAPSLHCLAYALYASALCTRCDFSINIFVFYNKYCVGEWWAVLFHNVLYILSLMYCVWEYLFNIE